MELDLWQAIAAICSSRRYTRREIDEKLFLNNDIAHF